METAQPVLERDLGVGVGLACVGFDGGDDFQAEAVGIGEIERFAHEMVAGAGALLAFRGCMDGMRNQRLFTRGRLTIVIPTRHANGECHAPCHHPPHPPRASPALGHLGHVTQVTERPSDVE